MYDPSDTDPIMRIFERFEKPGVYTAPLWDQMESPAEQELLDGLSKVYIGDSEIQVQVWIGKYRVDFRTGNVAWEIDGRDFHDRRRDMDRDAEILSSEEIDTIVRIQAAAYHWFPFACLRTFAQWLPDWPSRIRERRDVYTLDDAHKQGLLAWREEGDREQAIRGFCEGEAFACNDSIGLVGSPFAFLEFEHPLRDARSKVLKSPVHQWYGVLERRTRDNMDGWGKAVELWHNIIDGG